MRFSVGATSDGGKLQFTLARAMKLSVLYQSTSSNNRPQSAAIRESIQYDQQQEGKQRRHGTHAEGPS
jgi:hypothetical protein